MNHPTQAADFFAQYDSFGERRAGSTGDLASAAWLVQQLAGVRALHTTFQKVRFRRFLPGEATLHAQGVPRIQGLHLFDGGLTEPGGVTGQIGHAPSRKA